jgi:hypothetical protein
MLRVGNMVQEREREVYSLNRRSTLTRKIYLSRTASLKLTKRK